LESGFSQDELFTTSEPFLAQNSNFRLGGDSTADLLPKQIPNQKIYASSASSVDTYFFRKYKEYAKRMFMGDKNFFVADINCDAIISATFNGKLYPVPLLERREVDDALKQSQEKALREYYNKFTVEGGDNQIVKRATIIRNTEVYAPVLVNDTGKRKIIMAYDPAHDYDNAITMVAEILYDKNIGNYLRIINCVGFMDISKKKKKQLRTPEQIDYIKQMLLDYNGKDKADYENIDSLMIDSGAGGGGNIIGDYFMEDWVDKKGVSHKGLIDKEISAEHVVNFPNAVNKLRLVSPKKYKNEMFAAMEEMIKLDLVKFPKDYDLKGYIYINEDIIEDGEQIFGSEDEEVDVDDRGIQKGERKVIQYKLSQDEELALKQIDLAKEEVVNIYRFESGSSTRYGLPADKEKKMHDDRAYCLAMICWYLQQLRREGIVNKRDNFDWSKVKSCVTKINL